MKKIEGPMPWLKLEWEKLGWINIGSAVASFPWPGFPPDVHFSLSYNSGSDRMNLHLTRNVPGVPPENKPYIRIAEWPNSEAEEMAQMLFCQILAPYVGTFQYGEVSIPPVFERSGSPIPVDHPSSKARE
jgi:hypothetical protein